MLRRGVKAVLFDLDGVLVDSFEAWFHLFNYTLKHFGFKTLTRKQFRKDFGAPIESDVKRYFKGKTIYEVTDVYKKNYTKYMKHVKLMPHAKIVLEQLRYKKLKVGLITNSAKTIALALLIHFKLKRYFNVIVTQQDVKRRKPAPDMILKACKILKIKPKNTILIGDTKNDIIAGKRAGCITVGYKVKGDYRINKLNEVTKFI